MNRPSHIWMVAASLALLLFACAALAQSNKVACDNCQFENPADNSFCNRCGTELVKGTARHIGRKWDAAVLSVTPKTLVLNKGANDGIKKGDRFNILGIKEAFVDASGDTVGVEEMVVATLKIKSVSGESSIASYRGKGGYIPQSGDVAMAIKTTFLSRRVRFSAGWHTLELDDQMPVAEDGWPLWNGYSFLSTRPDRDNGESGDVLSIEIGVTQNIAVGISYSHTTLVYDNPVFEFSTTRGFARYYLRSGGITPYAEVFAGANSYSYGGTVHYEPRHGSRERYRFDYDSTGNTYGWSIGALAPVSSRVAFYLSYGSQTLGYDGTESAPLETAEGTLTIPIFGADSSTHYRFDIGMSFAFGSI